MQKKGRPHIVVFHGNAGNIESRGHRFKFLVDENYSVLLVSYRGYGVNPGKPTERDLISDSALALEWLFKQEGITSKDVVSFWRVTRIWSRCCTGCSISS